MAGKSKKSIKRTKIRIPQSLVGGGLNRTSQPFRDKTKYYRKQVSSIEICPICKELIEDELCGC